MILAKCSKGQRKGGVDKGAEILEDIIININSKSDSSDSEYCSELSKSNYHISNEQFGSNMGYVELFNIHQKLLNEVSYPVITLGGDHSIGHSTVSSSLNKYKDDLIVIWIDAHADINTHNSSLTKNTHGMPVSGLVGLEPNWISTSNHLLKPSNLVYYGIRDLDTAEVEFISDLKIKHFNKLDHIIKHLETLDINNKKVHISFDIDSLDPMYLDSTGTTASDGLNPKQIIELYNYIKIRSHIVALDIVELNPELGDLDKSTYTLKYILSEILSYPTDLATY